MTRSTTGIRLSETFRALLERALGPDGDLADAMRAYAYLGAAALGTVTGEHEREIARLLAKDLAPEVQAALRDVYNTCATAGAHPLHDAPRQAERRQAAAVPPNEHAGHGGAQALCSGPWDAVGIEV